MDLNKANKESEDPKYFRLYSAKEAFLMKSLKPKEWDNLIKRMVENPKLFDMFYR